ncbi:MAG: hypothetical protein P1U88_23470, partial [Thalassobaculaceae bacterium]|nr:hypothetical protein [Thalassobaculaceae bacterium]
NPTGRHTTSPHNRSSPAQIRGEIKSNCTQLINEIAARILELSVLRRVAVPDQAVTMRWTADTLLRTNAAADAPSFINC